MRLLIILALVYLLYRTVKKRLFSAPPVKGRASGTVEDEMIKDPVCGVYFPRRNAVRLTRDGKEMLFCSETCRERFLDGEAEGQ